MKKISTHLAMHKQEPAQRRRFLSLKILVFAAPADTKQ